MKPGMTLAERQAERQAYRDRAIRQANELGRTQRCRWAAQFGPPEYHHEQCRGEQPGNRGCLCECHDPAAEPAQQQGDA
jgi:hypothetical protein